MANQGQDTFRILIATDNHLGVWEKDETRKQDSFRSFEEIFEIAQSQKVDLVLLGGDLFHDNKPSRSTIVNSLRILSKYCLNDNPIRFQVLSDQSQNFANGRVNFAHPHFNVGLPVFSIHGNHDDPAGANNLSAVDVLSTCNLINYFGKVALSGSGIGKVRLSPVLLQKGCTKIALYGLGNVRDERLARMFQTPGCVEWVRPESSAAYPLEDWFNIFVLHQNRVQHTQGGKNSVRESYLAKFLDFVVWGHEHQCLPEPWESGESGCHFSVLQPGSSVATALSEGESYTKHCVMLEVCGDKYRTIKFPLQTVRPFVYETVCLADHHDLDPDQPESIPPFLEQRIDQLIQKARSQGGPRAPMPPLVRLKVDYTGFSTINTQRLGQKYVGKVANPHDIILWQKAAARRKVDADDGASDMASLRPEPLEETKIEELISSHLHTTLEILPESDLAAALHSFVEKEEKNALSECVRTALVETQAAAIAEDGLEGDDADRQVSKILSLKVQQRKAQQEVSTSVHRAAAGVASSSRPAGSIADDGGGAAGATVLDEDDDDDVVMIDADTTTTTTRNAKASTTKAGRGQAAKGVGRRQQSTLDRFTTSNTTGSRATPATAGRQTNTRGLGHVLNSTTGTGRAASGVTPTTKRTTRGRAKPTVRQAAFSDDDDDVDSIVGREGGGDDDEYTGAAASGDEEDAVEESEDEDEAGRGGRKRRRGTLNTVTKPAAARGTKAAAATRKKAAAAALESHDGAVVGSFVDSDGEDDMMVAGKSAAAGGGGGRTRLGGSRSQNTQRSRGWGALR